MEANRKGGDPVSRSLYSLILNDDVIARIDRLAVRENSNRSATVNRILAEYCSMLTPEKRIESVFDAVERLFGGDAELAVFVTPNQPAMFWKTSLAYRYRPTVRYDLRLYPHPEGGRIGELAVTFRTQSAELLERIGLYFRIWAAAERAARAANPPVYALAPGRMTRAVELDPACGDKIAPEVLAAEISDYVRLLDADLKAFVAGRKMAEEIAADCAARAETARVMA